MIEEILNFILEDQPQVVTLSPEEAEQLGHDTGEIEEFPIKRLSVPGSHIDFEESDGAIWILSVGTDEGQRRQGLAKGLLQFIADYAERTGKTVYHGSYTEDGEKYLKHVVHRIWSGQEK